MLPMLILSALLLVAAIVLYALVPAFLIYWQYPWPTYALLAASLACAVASRRRGAAKWLTCGVASLVTVLFLGYTVVFSQLDRPRLVLKVGDRFPTFSLATSTGETFYSADLIGHSAALYIFYRGGW